MRKIQLLLTAFAVLVAGTFVGVSDVNAQNTGECVRSCKDDCADLPKDERKSCKFSCMGGRCGIPGVIQAAEAADTPGVGCSEDGECNSFCEVGSDPDCVRIPCRVAEPGLVFFAPVSDVAGLVPSVYSQLAIATICGKDAKTRQDCAGTELTETCYQTLMSEACEDCLGIGDSASCSTCRQNLQSAMAPQCNDYQLDSCTWIDGELLTDASGCMNEGEQLSFVRLEMECETEAATTGYEASFVRPALPGERQPVCREDQAAILCFGY